MINGGQPEADGEISLETSENTATNTKITDWRAPETSEIPSENVSNAKINPCVIPGDNPVKSYAHPSQILWVQTEGKPIWSTIT